MRRLVAFGVGFTSVARVSDSPDGLDLDRLRAFFAEHVDGSADAPLQAELISGGRSNLTFGVTDGRTQYVVRRPPLGHVLPTAHDMQREFRVINALQGSNVPVPRTLAFCSDTEVVGSPFYVMARVDGRILRTPADMATLDADAARRCSEVLVDTLAALHAVDFRAVGLDDFGRPEGFCERQVRRWNKQWEASKAAGCPDDPAIDEISRRLTAAIPTSPAPTIVHGDYRLDNTMLHPTDAGNIVAVLDWEMSTLGDPLTDLGLFLLYWGRPDATLGSVGAPIPTDAGFLDRDGIVARYAAATGIALDELDWYELFASYKLAIILAGIHARYLMGMTRGEGFDHIGAMIGALTSGALDAASRSGIAGLRG